MGLAAGVCLLVGDLDRELVTGLTRLPSSLLPPETRSPVRLHPPGRPRCPLSPEVARQGRPQREGLEASREDRRKFRRVAASGRREVEPETAMMWGSHR